MINTRNFMHIRVVMDNFQDITRTNVAEFTAATEECSWQDRLS